MRSSYGVMACLASAAVSAAAIAVGSANENPEAVIKRDDIDIDIDDVPVEYATIVKRSAEDDGDIDVDDIPVEYATIVKREGEEDDDIPVEYATIVKREAEDDDGDIDADTPIFYATIVKREGEDDIPVEYATIVKREGEDDIPVEYATIVKREGEDDIPVEYATIVKREGEDDSDIPVEYATIVKRQEDDVVLRVVKKDDSEYGIFVREGVDGAQDEIVVSTLKKRADETEDQVSVEVFKRQADDADLVYKFGADNIDGPVFEFSITKRGDVEVSGNSDVEVVYAVLSKKHNLYPLADNLGLAGNGGLNKREPKNVVDLHRFVPTKREAKNVVDLHRLIPSKREAKNVVDLTKLHLNTKREAKNVVDLTKLHFNTKREAKRVVDLTKVFPIKRDDTDDVDTTVYYATIVKRDENKWTMSIEDALSVLVGKSQQILKGLSHQPVGTETVSTKDDQQLVGDDKSSAINTLLDTEPHLSIFANYLRDFDVGELRHRKHKMHNNKNKKKHCNGSANKKHHNRPPLLVFAPLDEAFDKYSQKPWEYPYPVDSEEDAKRNLNFFIKGHISHPRRAGPYRTFLGQDIVVDGNRVMVNGVEQAQVKEMKNVGDYIVAVIDNILVKP